MELNQKRETKLYRLILGQLKITTEYDGKIQRTFVGCTILRNSSISKPLSFKQTPITLKGHIVDLYVSEDGTGETTVDVLTAAYQPNDAIVFGLPSETFGSFVQQIQKQVINEVEILLEAYFDNSTSPKDIHFHFKKLWLRSTPKFVRHPLRRRDVVCAIVIGLALFEWIKGFAGNFEFLSWLLPFGIIGLVIYVFWPVPYLRLYFNNKRYWREVEKRRAE